MRFVSRTRPSPAVVVACIALSFALAGSAVAGPAAVTSKLDGKEKKQVKKLAKREANKQIQERAPGLSVAHAATAGSATSATSATNAANAANADAVGGVTVRGFHYQTPSNGAQATLFAVKGLTLTAGCSSGRVDAKTSVNDSYISSSWVTPGDVALGDADTDFDTADTFLANIGTGAKTGSIEYVQPDGQRVSVTLQADMAAACTVSGHAFASG